jgi:hypothetical protein
MNYELWRAVQMHQKGAKTNVSFERQLQAMLDGSWNPSPDATQMPQMDELLSSDSVDSNQPGVAQQMFGQGAQPSRIKDLFPNMPRAPQTNIPPEYKEFYENLPDVTDFPPEREEE